MLRLNQFKAAWQMSCALAISLASFAAALGQTVEFNRDIRPILSDNCFQCHGPDSAERKADLRLDDAKDALADRGGYHVIAPGKADESELLLRVVSEQKSKRMPPASSGKQLNAQQVALLRRWIAEGAKYERHWSFIPLRRPALPDVKNAAWLRSPIDAFILARLEREGLTPAPEANRATLIRRVTLDLTGLPPTPAEVDAFLQDTSADAYGKVVDRLLRSPRYGERMASLWLDAARYADTNGYQTDGERVMWRWRDWVIDAFNRNMPFDQFTLEQIAGDMLPGATLEQKIATGFNRNHRGNSEGGVIPEEYAVEYVVDRVDTTATIWLGLTIGCARCHDHKYDPVSQKEFYQAFAYFNNVPERGKAIKYGNSPPYIKSPTAEQQKQLARLTNRLQAARKRFAELQTELADARRVWEQSIDPGKLISWRDSRGLTAHLTLDTVGQAFQPAMADKNVCPTVQGRLGQAIRVDRKSYFNAGDIGKFGFFDKFSIAVWFRADDAAGGAILSRMEDNDRAEGYSLVLQDGKLLVNLSKRWLDDAIRVETENRFAPGRWHHAVFTYDGSRLADGVSIHVNGKLQKLKVNLDDLNQSFLTKEPFRLGAGNERSLPFSGLIDEVCIYSRVLSGTEIAVLMITDAINEIAALAPASRTKEQAEKLRLYYLDQQAPPHIQTAHRELLRAQDDYVKFDETIPTTMIMQEMKTPRATHVLIRGQYDKPGERVHPGVPAGLPPLPEGAPNNRLGFAKWLIDPANPLTARVAVNRYWQMLFGEGIVHTVEDFGSQGEWPSHPELLDWLASDFVGAGWEIKGMLKTMVMSATYRQSSKLNPMVLAKDPENRLLSRGPRTRLSADMIRDQALFVSGLLAPKIGGPSVKPYQPEGLWEELSGEKYVRDTGAKLYRRSLYTFWKRTIPPPAMMNFDAANREACVVRHSRTNTPLQALNLMNDVAFVEAARLMAERIIREGGQSPAQRLTHAFRLAAARPPSAAELAVLQAGLAEHLAHYRTYPKAAEELLGTGDHPRDQTLNAAEVAAYTTCASLVLNLDEVITKE